MKMKFFIYVLMVLPLLVVTGKVKGQQVSGDWRSLGPMTSAMNLTGYSGGVTRVARVKFHPTDANIMYAVSVTGGLFISKDAGKHWVPGGTDMIDHSTFATVCIDHTDDRIMYVGTGDPNYYNGTTGVWKTVNGGKTWTQSNTNIGNRLVLEILMSPFDHNVLMAATDDGLWKSTDAGNTWTVKKPGGRFTDMVFKPTTGGKTSTIYAAEMSRFYKSTDLGETWTQVVLPGAGIENGGRIGVSKADSNLVYLTYVGRFKAKICTPVLKSINSGASFAVVKPAGLPNLNGYSETEGGQENYDFGFTVDPVNTNILYAGGHVVQKSTDGGVTWVRKVDNWTQKLHTDYHQFVFSPYSNSKLYITNDGGISLSTDGGETWNDQNDGLAGLETYNLTQNPIRKDIVSCGAQDNGEYVFINNNWYINGGGDFNHKLAFGYTKKPYRYDLEGNRKLLPNLGEENLNLPSSIKKIDGNYTDRVMVFSPLDTNLSFFAQKEVYRTTNLNTGLLWTAPLTSFNSGESEIFIRDMAISPASTSVLYVATSDGMLHRTDNALAAAPSFSHLASPGATSNGSCIELIKSNSSIVYMSCGSSIYRSSNKGAAGSWTDLTDNTLDGTNIIEVLHDPYSTDESVYIATNLGVYYRNTTLNHWINYSKGLPRITYIKQLGLFSDGTANSELRVGTNGRGIFTSSLNGNTPLMRDPENPAIISQGLSYSYYEGTWTRLPNFGSLTPVKSGSVTTFDIAPRNRDDLFGFAYKGYINITTAGAYTFTLNSDEGSRLYIGDNLVVDNDGQHLATTDVNGTINLKAGKHAISVYYFENTGSQSLTVSYAGPSIAKQVIPSTVLFRIPDPVSCTGTGNLSREFWKDVPGTTVADIPVLNAPYINDKITDYLMINFNQGDNYGERLRGYVCAPYTGNYTFYVTGNDSYELWLSTDNKPENKRRIAYGVQAGITEWEANATQKSGPIALSAGQKYYIEVLHKESTGDDYVGVGWQLPSGEFERPIAANSLSPFTGNQVSPNVTLTTPAYNAYYVTGSSLTLTATANDFNGTISKVEFFSNGTKLGEDAVAPYTFPITSLSAGSYVFTARATDNDNLTSDSKVNVQVVNLRTAENPTTFLKGTDYKYYEGSFNIFTDYNSLIPKKTGAAANFDLSLQDREENYAFVYSGYINIPADGFYTFYTSSDDVSKFYIGSTPLISNDRVNFEMASSVIGLKAGKHLFRLEYANQGGEDGLTVKYEGPGINKQLIPDAALFRPSGGANIPPMVNISSPENWSGGITSGNLTITANATDADGTVSKVEFFANGNKLGEDAVAPFSYLWTGPAAGTYYLTAKATDNNAGTTVSITDTFFVMNTRIPENPTSIVSGLDYKYYEGAWSSLPDFTIMTPKTIGNVRDLILTPRLKDDNFGFSFTGYLDVPADGVYRFFLSSDDGSKFYVGNTLVVDNDGLHGMDEKEGMIGLKAGKHAIRVDFFESGGGQDIALFYSGPGLFKQSVPEAALYRPGTNAAPSVSITAPVNNASFTAPATINIAASASDADGTITKVEFYQGNTLLGTSATSPYSYSWTSVPGGNYSITAKAYDNGGATKTSTAVAITVTSVNQLPTVSITAPANNASFTAPAAINIAASASDADGTITKVEFYQGNTLLGSSATSPYSFSWTSVPAGNYSLTAKAYDNAGATKTSTAVAVTVTSVNQLPTVSITAPANNASFTAPATINIAASASDADGTITKVEFYQGNTLLGSSATSPYSFSWTNVLAGNYSLTAKAYDNVGATKTSTPVAVTVTSGNQLPTVSITAPANNASFTAPATINITASAADADGTITKVEFYQGNTLLGTSTASPYSYSWTNVGAGIYSLTAKAYDNVGATKTSTAATVTVTGTQACNFGTPLSTPLPSIPYTQYNKIYLLGQGGPNLSNVTSFVINWDLTNKGLYNFAFNTSNGIPAYYVDLKTVSTNTFGSAAPSVTFTNSGFSNLDGSYYAGTRNGDFVLVSKTSSFTIYFTNATSTPVCSATRLATTIADASEGTTLIPNPAQSYVEVQSDMELTKATVWIMDALGSEVSVPFEVHGNSLYLDLSNTEPGIYSVTIKDGDRIAVKKMAVAR